MFEGGNIFLCFLLLLYAFLLLYEICCVFTGLLDLTNPFLDIIDLLPQRSDFILR